MNKFNKFYKPTNEFDELLVSDIYVGERESSIRADYEAADTKLDNAIKAEEAKRESEDTAIKNSISDLDNKLVNRKTINVETISGDINRHFEKLIRIDNVDINELKVQLGQTIYLVEGHDDALTGYHTYEEYICQNPESVTVDTLPVMVRFGAVDSILARGEDVEGDERQNRFGSVELCHNLYTNDPKVWSRYFEKDLDGNLIHDNPKAGKAVAPCALRDFVINDDDIRTKFAEADSAIRTDFTNADSKIREDFINADNEVRKDFAAADLVINNRIDSIDVRTSNLETDVEYLMVEVGGNEIEGEVEESKSRIDKIEQIIGMGERCDICHENGHCTVDGKCNEEHPLTDACSILCKLERIDERIEENFKSIDGLREENDAAHSQIGIRIGDAETRIDAVENRTSVIEGQIGDVNTKNTILWDIDNIKESVIPKLKADLEDYTDTAESNAIDTSKVYTDDQIKIALNTAAQRASDMDRVSMLETLTQVDSKDNQLKSTIENWVSTNFTTTANTEIAKGDAVDEATAAAKSYTDGRESSIKEWVKNYNNDIISKNYTDADNTLADALRGEYSQIKSELITAIDTAKNNAISEANDYTDETKLDAVAEANDYTDESIANLNISELRSKVDSVVIGLTNTLENAKDFTRDHVLAELEDFENEKIKPRDESLKAYVDTQISNYNAEYHKFHTAIISATLPADNPITTDFDERFIILKYSDLQDKLPGNIPANALTIVVNSIRYTGYVNEEKEIRQVVPDVIYRGDVTEDNIDTREIEISFTGEAVERNVLISITYYNNSGDSNPIIYI